jgi:protein arginine kinase activator
MKFNDFNPIIKSYSMDTLWNNLEFLDICQEPVQIIKVCPNCGFNFNTFTETGFLGCSKCYDNFKKELEPYINEIGGE